MPELAEPAVDGAGEVHRLDELRPDLDPGDQSKRPSVATVYRILAEDFTGDTE